MARRKEETGRHSDGSIGNQQGTTQTGAQNSGGQRREQDADTSRTSSQGRKLASGGSKNTNNKGHEKEGSGQ